MNPRAQDGIVAFWFLSGGAWACESQTGVAQHAKCYAALHELLAAAVAGGAPQADCDELVDLLTKNPKSPRAMVLAVQIAFHIPEDVVGRVTDLYLGDFAVH